MSQSWLIRTIMIWIYEALIWVGAQPLMPLAGIPRNATGLVFGKAFQESIGVWAYVIGTGIHFVFAIGWGILIALIWPRASSEDQVRDGSARRCVSYWHRHRFVFTAALSRETLCPILALAPVSFAKHPSGRSWFSTAANSRALTNCLRRSTDKIRRIREGTRGRA
jgi:hypothetical protein